jgi:hypothetical protein
MATADINKRLKNLQKQICCVNIDVQQDITDINQDISDINQDITNVQQDVTDIQQDITDIQQDITDLQNEVNEPERFANYAALPAAATYTDKSVIVENSQGTEWLPWNWGGTYHPKGYYYSDGISWHYAGDFASQATQAEVNTGAIDNKFVTPLTLANSTGNTGPKTYYGDVTLSENVTILFNPAGSADGKYSGFAIMGTAGDTLIFGDLITLDADDSRWEKVDISVAAAATGDARGMLGVALGSSTDGNPIKILLQGTIRADARFPAITISASVWASTAGDIISTRPITTDYVQRVIGQGLTANEIYFNPSADWQTQL